MQTSYTGLKPLQHNLYSYMGGFCKWWYIPVEDIATFPRVNPANQYLNGEPVLFTGKSWFGPIVVPRDKFGYTEASKRTKAGPYYETKVDGVHMGDSPESRVNLENMIHHRYLIVGKVRAGGFYKLLGTVDSPFDFNPVYDSGSGPIENAQTTLSFFTEHISKAYVLGTFTGDVTVPANSGSGGPNPMNNEKETIPFGAGDNTNIVWTPARVEKYGTMPLIQVYLQDSPDELPYLHFGGSIEVDAPPPQTTEFFVKPGANVPGFIVIG